MLPIQKLLPVSLILIAVLCSNIDAGEQAGSPQSESSSPTVPAGTYRLKSEQPYFSKESDGTTPAGKMAVGGEFQVVEVYTPPGYPAYWLVRSVKVTTSPEVWMKADAFEAAAMYPAFNLRRQHPWWWGTQSVDLNSSAFVNLPDGGRKNPLAPDYIPPSKLQPAQGGNVLEYLGVPKGSTLYHQDDNSMKLE